MLNQRFYRSALSALIALILILAPVMPTLSEDGVTPPVTISEEVAGAILEETNETPVQPEEAAPVADATLEEVAVPAAQPAEATPVSEEATKEVAEPVTQPEEGSHAAEETTEEVTQPKEDAPITEEPAQEAGDTPAEPEAGTPATEETTEEGALPEENVTVTEEPAEEAGDMPTEPEEGTPATEDTTEEGAQPEENAPVTEEPADEIGDTPVEPEEGNPATEESTEEANEEPVLGEKALPLTEEPSEEAAMSMMPMALMYQVVFHLNGGAVGGSSENIVIDVQPDSSINASGAAMPANPVKANAPFLGWSINPAAHPGNYNYPVNRFNADTPVKANPTNVYAIYADPVIVATSYTPPVPGGYVKLTFSQGKLATFDGDDDGIVILVVKVGTDISLVMAKVPSITPNKGYVVTGWSKPLPDTVTESDSYKVVCTGVSHKLTFNPMGGVWKDGTTESITVEVPLGSRVLAYRPHNETPPVKDDVYSSTGWADKDGNEITMDTLVQGDMTVFATYPNVTHLPLEVITVYKGFPVEISYTGRDIGSGIREAGVIGWTERFGELGFEAPVVTTSEDMVENPNGEKHPLTAEWQFKGTPTEVGNSPDFSR